MWWLEDLAIPVVFWCCAVVLRKKNWSGGPLVLVSELDQIRDRRVSAGLRKVCRIPQPHMKPVEVSRRKVQAHGNRLAVRRSGMNVDAHSGGDMNSEQRIFHLRNNTNAE